MSILLDTMLLRRTRRNAYESLRRLDDHLLRDIGFDRHDLSRVVTGRDFARLQDLGR